METATLGPAICADTKIVPCWHVGKRNAQHARLFISDLADRLANRVQLTTDGHKAYLNAVEDSFGANIDYAMLVKLYGEPLGKSAERKYSPGECCGTIVGTVCGNPDEKHISTSYVERANLTMRMSMRRFTKPVQDAPPLAVGRNERSWGRLDAYPKMKGWLEWSDGVETSCPFGL